MLLLVLFLTASHFAVNIVLQDFKVTDIWNIYIFIQFFFSKK